VTSPSADPEPLVIRISPMAHLPVGFLALGLVTPVLIWPLTAPLLLIPVLLSALLVRWRTIADTQQITVQSLFTSRSAPWDEIDGLGFSRGSWARAHLNDGEQLRLPAVSFATLPLLTEASGGRVPNPYR